MLFLALTALFYGFKTTILLRCSKVFPGSVASMLCMLMTNPWRWLEMSLAEARQAKNSDVFFTRMVIHRYDRALGKTS